MSLKPKMSPPEIDRTKKKKIQNFVDAAGLGVSKSFMKKVGTFIVEGTTKDKSRLIQFIDKLETKVKKN